MIVAISRVKGIFRKPLETIYIFLEMSCKAYLSEKYIFLCDSEKIFLKTL